MTCTRLRPGLLSALKALANGSDVHPDRAIRPDFHALVNDGLAVWTGYGHGGEGFRITPAGRAALKANADG